VGAAAWEVDVVVPHNAVQDGCCLCKAVVLPLSEVLNVCARVVYCFETTMLKQQ
jgi:hypothetical protein